MSDKDLEYIRELAEKDESDYEYITKVGHCIYCNQSKMVEVFEGDLLDVSSLSEYINLCVTKECECEMAREERNRKYRIERGQESVSDFFKAKYPEAAKMLCDAVELIVEGKIKKITIDTGNCEKAIVECNSAGKIKVQSKVSKNKAAEV